MIHDCPSCGAQNRVPAARLGARAHCGRCKGDLLPLAGPLPVHSEAEFDELVRDSQLPVVVDFWASWCPPCRAVAPELESLAKTKSGQAVVAKVDTDALPRLAARFGIRSIPTMVLFRGGQEAKRVSGAMPAPAIAAQLSL